MDAVRVAQLIEKSIRLHDAGVTYEQIEARRSTINAANKAADPEHYTEVDFNGALEDLYRETFSGVTV